MSARWEAASAVARFFAALDGQDWERVASWMTDPIHIDYESFGAGPAAARSPAGIISDWQQIVPGFERTHHQLGNLDITADGDAAEVRCYVTAAHVIGERCWTVAGQYEISLVRAQGGWRLASLRLLYRYQLGQELLPVAMERAARQAAG